MVRAGKGACQEKYRRLLRAEKAVATVLVWKSGSAFTRIEPTLNAPTAAMEKKPCAHSPFSTTRSFIVCNCGTHRAACPATTPTPLSSLSASAHKD